MFGGRDEVRELQREVVRLREVLGACQDMRTRDGETIDRLQHQLTIERLKRRFAQQERDVFRRRWEKAMRPKAVSATPAERIEVDGRRLVAQAIAARTPAGDTQTAPLLQNHADRRAAELARERRGELTLRDWQTIADEILVGERDDD